MDVRVALTGFGSVGQGLATLLAEHGDEYRRRYGVGILLTGVADTGGAVTDVSGLDPVGLLEAKRRGGTVASHPQGKRGVRGAEFLTGADAHVLVEAASTNFEDAEPGWTYVRDSLSRNMDVVLASKGALVLHYGQLMRDARSRGRRVLFSGTTGAPLPVLELADRVLLGVEIAGFEGIVNATTNQILTSMGEGSTYEEGLRAAQQAGIAETDPTLDVDGWDAAAKATIIARAVMNAEVSLPDVERTGIRGVTPQHLADAGRRGNRIKLVARAERTNGEVRAYVRLEERPAADVLGRLKGLEMGIVFRTDILGSVAATVEHTGGVPTALTVLRDLINLARDRGWSSPS